jgi:uncharacterized protein (TIGR00369 family)
VNPSARHESPSRPDPAGNGTAPGGLGGPGEPTEPAEPGGRQRAYQWQDPTISAAAARQLDGLSFFQEILAGRLPPPPIMATLGFSAVSFERGKAVFEMTPAEYHYNPIGSVHGGVYATLCDSACGCAVQTMLPAGVFYTSVDLAVRFIRPITSDTGRLICEGTVEHLGSRIALAQARLTSPEGKLFAHATSNCLIISPA